MKISYNNTTLWKEYKRLLFMQRHYEHNKKLKSWALMSKQWDVYDSLTDLDYWARKDLEAFEEKEMLPRFNSKLFWIYRRAYQLTGR